MDFNEYDEGFRLGTFDKCNGRDFPRIEEDGSIYAGGYYDAWRSNVNQMAESEDWDPVECDKACETAFREGEKFALEVLRPLVDKAREQFSGTKYEDEARESFYDGLHDVL